MVKDRYSRFSFFSLNASSIRVCRFGEDRLHLNARSRCTPVSGQRKDVGISQRRIAAGTFLGTSRGRQHPLCDELG